MSTEADIPKWLHNAFEATSAAKKDIALRMLWDELVAARAERDAAARDMRERCAGVADAMTKKWGKPNGDAYEQGAQDQGIRISHQIGLLPDTPAVIATDQTGGAT